MDFDLELDLNVDTSVSSNIMNIAKTESSERKAKHQTHVVKSRTSLSGTKKSVALGIKNSEDDEALNSSFGQTASDEADISFSGRKRQRPRGFSPDMDSVQKSSVSGMKKKTVKPDEINIKSPRSSSVTPTPSSSGRKSGQNIRMLAHETPEWEGSLFAKPILPTRQRTKTANRYSPSPDPHIRRDRKISEKIRLSDLGNILRAHVRNNDPVDFILPDRLFSDVKGIKKASHLESKSVAVRDRNTPSVESSDEDSAEEESHTPVVRMADIAAAPFISTPVLPTKPKTPKSSNSLKIGTIKLPKRKKIDVNQSKRAARLKMDKVSDSKNQSPSYDSSQFNEEESKMVTRHSSITGTPSVSTSVTSTSPVITNNVSPLEKAEDTIVTIPDLDVQGVDSWNSTAKKAEKSESTTPHIRPSRPSRGNRRSSNVTTDDSLGNDTIVSKKKKFSTDVTSENQESNDIAESQPLSSLSNSNKAASYIGSRTLDARPKRSSAGKSREFIAQVTGKRFSSLRKDDSERKPDIEESEVASIGKEGQQSDFEDSNDSDLKLNEADAFPDIPTGSELPLSLSTGRTKKSANTSRRTATFAEIPPMETKAKIATPETNIDSLQNIRRSGRNHTLTEKMRDLASRPLPSTLKQKPVDPNSALGILQRASKFIRPARTPSPEPAPALISQSQLTTSMEEKDGSEHLTNISIMGESEQKETEEQDMIPGDKKLDNDSISDTNEGDVMEEQNDFSTSVMDSMRSQEEKTYKDGNKMEDDSEKELTMSLASTSHTPTIEGGRSSRRIVKPSRFLDSDFVSPLNSRTVHKEFTKSPERKISPRKDCERAPSDNSGGVDSLETPSGVETSATVMSTNSKPVAVFTMKTRRRSSFDKERPIRIKLSLGGHTPRVIENTGAVSSASETEKEGKLEEVESAMVLEPSKKVEKEKTKSLWAHYVPSVKPVLGHVYYSNGVTENLGVSVGAVMDRLLLEVCQDGITRHSNIISKEEKRRRNAEKTRARYIELKAEVVERMAAAEARGEPMTRPISHYVLGLDTKPNRGKRDALPSRELGPRKRGRNSGRFQNEYLYPSLKRGKNAEELKDEETRKLRTRKTLDFLSKQFKKEVDEAIRSRGKPSMRRRRDSEIGEKTLQEEEEREKQKKSKTPISFDTFLSSKSTSSVVRPKLRPQPIEPSPPDLFYRELLTDLPERSIGEVETDPLDIVSANPEGSFLDDVVPPPPEDSSATPVAEAIERVMMRPTNYDGSYGVSDLYMRAREEPELRRALLDSAVDVITSQYVSETAACGREASVVVYNAAMKNASRLRDAFSMFSAERRDSIYWVHRFLVELLPVHFLSSYLVLLRYAKSLTNSYVSQIVKSTVSDITPWQEVTQLVCDYTSNKVIDPEVEQLNRTISSPSLTDVVFLLVSPAMTVGDYVVKARYHDHVYKWLRQLAHPDSQQIKINLGDESELSIAEACDLAVEKVLSMVRHTVKIHRHRRVVLVGWGTSCYINHRVLQLTHGVSAVIDLGFPVISGEGPRGTADDDILLTYCPSLFVVGAQACDFSPRAIKELRMGMLMPSGLVVIGHADNNLHVSCHTLSQLNITQRVVNRSVVEQVCEFLSLEDTKRERSQLIPVDLHSVYNVDNSIFREKAPATMARRIKEEATEDRKPRKRKLMPTPTPSPLPSEPSPFANPTLENSRSYFDNTLKKAIPDSKRFRFEEKKGNGTEKGRDFKEPKAPIASYRASPIDSPLPRRGSSPNPPFLDPASISLS